MYTNQFFFIFSMEVPIKFVGDGRPSLYGAGMAFSKLLTSLVAFPSVGLLGEQV